MIAATNTYCYDPKHEDPCPDPQTCPGCNDECSPKWWKTPEEHMDVVDKAIEILSSNLTDEEFTQFQEYLDSTDPNGPDSFWERVTIIHQKKHPEMYVSNPKEPFGTKDVK